MDMNGLSPFMVTFIILLWALLAGYNWLLHGGANSRLMRRLIGAQTERNLRHWAMSRTTVPPPELAYLWAWQQVLAAAAALGFVALGFLVFTWIFLAYGSLTGAMLGGTISLVAAYAVWKWISELP